MLCIYLRIYPLLAFEFEFVFQRFRCLFAYEFNVVLLNGCFTPENVVYNFRSFIADIYVAPLQVGLLRSAPNHRVAEQSCFKLLKEFLREDFRKRCESQWETIPDHGEVPDLHSGVARKWDMKEALLSRAEVAGTPSAKGRTTKVSKVGFSFGPLDATLQHNYYCFCFALSRVSSPLYLQSWSCLHVDSDIRLLRQGSPKYGLRAGSGVV